MVPVRISTIDPEIDPNTGKFFFRNIEETTANLSRGGAYLRSWEPLEAGRRVVIAMDLATGEELQLAGRVVWTRRELRPKRAKHAEAPGYGIEFFGNSKSELAQLDHLIGSPELTSRKKSASDTADAAPTSSMSDGRYLPTT